MRLASFRPLATPGARAQVGVVVDDNGDVAVVTLPAVTSLVELLALDPEARARVVDRAAGDVLPLRAVELLPPVYPVAMRDFYTYERHVAGTARAVQGMTEIPAEWYQAPGFLFMAPHAVHGPFADVPMPPDTERLDYELELAVVVCRDGRNLSVEEAGRCIGGYLVMNDWSARDVMSREMRMGLGPCKGKDFATTIGPWVVTPDELEGYRRGGLMDLAMTVSRNGVEAGSDRSSSMAWSFEQLLSYASRGSWVKAGEVIGSGTCSGGSMAEAWGRTGVLEPPPLVVGDRVEMTIEGIGTIANPVVAGDGPVPPVPAARRG